MIIVSLIFLIIATEVHAEKYTCKDWGVEGLCIEIEFVSMKEDFKTPSEYKFPNSVKINDYLVVRKITVINKPKIVEESKDTPDVTLTIDAYPFGLERRDVERFESTRYSTIHLPLLKVNDVYELTYLNEWAYYEAKLNNQVIKKGQFNIYPKKLFTEGAWIIEDKVVESFGERRRTTISFIAVSLFDSTLINGDWKNNFFKVYSNVEIKNLETAENNLKFSKISLGVVIFIALATIVVQYWLAREQEKSLKEITEELRNVIQSMTEKQINEQKTIQ